MRHSYRCSIRWGDIDAFQHVNNVYYLEYLQEARVDMFWVHPARQGLTPLAKGVVVARHEIDYLAPITWREEPILIEIWATKISASSFHLAYVLRDESTIFAKAKSVMVPYDLENQCPRRMDASERSALEPFLEEKP
jgi:acyl-CoA thioester hydrolase